MYVYACKCVFYGLQILKVGILSRFQGSLLQLHFVDSYKFTLKKYISQTCSKIKKNNTPRQLKNFFDSKKPCVFWKIQVVA